MRFPVRYNYKICYAMDKYVQLKQLRDSFNPTLFWI